MDWRTITVDAEVDIYIKDVKDEVLKELSNEELIEELNSREVNYEEKSTKYHMLDKSYASPSDIYEHLCDIVGCGYHEPKQSVLDKLKDMM